MSQILPTSIVSKSSAQVSTLVENETVVLQLATGTYFSLNEVGQAIWKALEEPRSIQLLCDQVMHEYEVDEGQCMLDVVGLVEQLLNEKLIELS